VAVTSAADTVCQVLCNVRTCKKRETKSRAAVSFPTSALYDSVGISHFSLLCLTSISSAPILSIRLMATPSGRLTLDRPGNKPLTGGIKTVRKIKKKKTQCGCMMFSTTAKHPRTWLSVKSVFPLPVLCSPWVCIQKEQPTRHLFHRDSKLNVYC